MKKSVLFLVVLSLTLVSCQLQQDDLDDQDMRILAWLMKRVIGNQCPANPDPEPPKSGSPTIPDCGCKSPEGKKPPTEEIPEDPKCGCNPGDRVCEMRQMYPEAFCLLGMKDRTIPDSAITGSSIHSASYCQYGNARLDHYGAWCASANTPGTQWVQVDLGSVQYVTGVVTQGQGYSPGANEWVTSFKIQYGTDADVRTTISENTNAKVFSPANFNQNTMIVTRFPEPIEARYIRIVPMSLVGHMSLRFDVINC